MKVMSHLFWLRVRRFTTKVFFPNDPFRMLLNILGLVFILYDMIFLPMRISFQVPLAPWMYFADVCINAFFIFEIVVNFNTAYFQQGNLIKDRRRIALKYLRLWFWVDAIASVPFSILESCLLYTSPSPRDRQKSRMPSSA
eukprot:TRINITY_DN25575_c0_g2_i1.p1 TRINITY_DN25575_c0_g2~~TRINITY_DN25575_c0_g2_i1.p1  ORF type:complete len:141 (-),score=25.77 TRINITY_DN25575_c0_g2_i1:6-428(-)